MTRLARLEDPSGAETRVAETRVTETRVTAASAEIVRAVPAEVHADGRAWTVRRAWPSGAGVHTTIEVQAPGVRGVRAGRWSPERVVVAAEGADRRLPGLVWAAGQGEILSWRRGRRAVIRLDDGSGYVKVVLPETVADIEAAHGGGHPFLAGFRVPETTPDITREGVLRLPTVPGRTLHDLGADARVPDAEVTRAWRAWADGWCRVAEDSRRLSAAPGRCDPAPLPTPAASPSATAVSRGVRAPAHHDGAAEAAVLARWTALAAPLLGDLGALLLRAGDAVAEDLVARAADAGAAVPAHRDLHDKQVLWSGDGAPGLIDLDTRTTAEAALDIANLRAHIGWRQAQGRLSDRRAAAARAAVDDVIVRTGTDPERVGLYEMATRLRLGALYVYRPAWRTMATAWTAVAVRAVR